MASSVGLLVGLGRYLCAGTAHSAPGTAEVVATSDTRVPVSQDWRRSRLSWRPSGQPCGIIGVPDVEDRFSAWSQCRRYPCRSSSSDWIRDSSTGRHICYKSSRVRMRDALFCDRWHRTGVSRDFPRPVNCCLLPTPWNPSPLVTVLTPPGWRTRNLLAQLWRPHLWRVCSSVLTTWASIRMWVWHAAQKMRQRSMSWNKCWNSNVPSTVRVRTPKKSTVGAGPSTFWAGGARSGGVRLSPIWVWYGEYVELLPRPCCLKTASCPVPVVHTCRTNHPTTNDGSRTFQLVGLEQMSTLFATDLTSTWTTVNLAEGSLIGTAASRGCYERGARIVELIVVEQ